jgi:NADH-quinone oxidoreductase subunit I
MTIEIQRGKVIEVERGRGKFRAGQGLLRGMGVIWRHWQGSFRKNEGFDQIYGVFTEEYPDEQPKLPEAYRNMPILLYDDESGHELCTSCFQCQRICPPQVIHITQEKDPATGKAVPAAAEFIIEYDACMSCGFCAEVCPFDAIKMDHTFELSTADHPDLTVAKEQLNRPVSYYQRIAPTFWEAAQAGAYKKLQGSMKRRSGVIGIAPQLADEIRARQAAAPAPETPPAKEPPAAAATETPAAPRKLTPEEKAAKLAAIRAKNAGQAGTAPEAPADEAAPADDKAAKLAAIRAKNAAKKAAETGDASATEAAPADDKAAKLAAIRAKNAAKKAAETGDAPAAEAAPAEAAPDAPPADDKAARLAAIRAKNAARKAAETGSVAPAEAAPDAPPADDKAARLAAIRAKNAARKAAEEQKEDGD